MTSDSASQVAFSVLDLAAVAEGNTPTDTFRNSLDLAQHVEKLGYTRLWVAEHHNMAGVASSAPPVLIGYLAGGTSTLRVGPGGRFGQEQDFGRDIQQLQTYFSASNSGSTVRAIPGEGLDIPIYVLGSSTDSAYLAAAMGLPYAFASHFAPGQLFKALEIYRHNFKPSAALAAPYVITCVNVIAADTDDEAQYLATTLYQMMLGVITGQRRLMQPPVKDMDAIWTPDIKQYVLQMLAASFIGSKNTVKDELADFLAQTQANEVIVSSHIFSHEARLHSYELLADVMREINQPQVVGQLVTS